MDNLTMDTWHVPPVRSTESYPGQEDKPTNQYSDQPPRLNSILPETQRNNVNIEEYYVNPIIAYCYKQSQEYGKVNRNKVSSTNTWKEKDKEEMVPIKRQIKQI